MTGKRFTITQDFEEHHRQIRDNGKIIMGCFIEAQAEPIVKLLNELHEEKEYWKGNACNNSNFVNILLHELDIAQKKGYEVSDPFKKLMEEKELEE